MIGALWATLRGVVAPWLSATWLRVLIPLVVVALIGVAGWRVSVWHEAHRRLGVVQDALQAERDCVAGTACADRLAQLRTAGIAAVETARRTAQEAAGREQARRDAEVRLETERLTAAASEARVKADRWRARYEAALVSNQACSAWAQAPVPCPIGP